uniref:C2H2-type domain-containing protein n=1 Tax=Meloidogyne incognita TaxID=6306 RepID=A0A914NWS7_MELIC
MARLASLNLAYLIEQGCGKCPKNIAKTDCYNCTEKYCNEEKHIDMHCWLNDKEICKTPFTGNCFTERTEDNKRLWPLCIFNMQQMLHTSLQ